MEGTLKAGRATVLAVLLLLPACSRGPELDDRTITLEFDATPAGELIQICADQGGFPVEYADEEAAKQAGRPISLHVLHRPWHEALSEAVGKAGLRSRWRRRGEDWILVLERGERK